MKVQLNEVNLLQNLLTGIKSKIKQLCTTTEFITLLHAVRGTDEVSTQQEVQDDALLTDSLL